MYAKIINSEVVKYPYTASDLYAEHPDTSFPDPLPEETINSFNVYTISEQPQPQVDYTKTVTEGSPVLVNGVWTQAWNVTDASADEITQRKADLLAQAQQQRETAYRNEADALFFKAQRNEGTMDDWIAKVNEIKTRYPYPVFPA
jgi:hypothetical protein